MELGDVQGSIAPVAVEGAGLDVLLGGDAAELLGDEVAELAVEVDADRRLDVLRPRRRTRRCRS